jgi:hypothetical protein
LILSVTINTTEQVPFDWTKYPRIDFVPISWLMAWRGRYSALVVMRGDSALTWVGAKFRNEKRRVADDPARMQNFANM